MYVLLFSSLRNLGTSPACKFTLIYCNFSVLQEGAGFKSVHHFLAHEILEVKEEWGLGRVGEKSRIGCKIEGRKE